MQSDSCHFSQTFLIRTDTRGTVPSVQRYRGYRVFQKFIPVENCILCIASDASVGKFKLIQLRNLPGKQFKAISNKNLKKLCFWNFAPNVHACVLFPAKFFLPICRFSYFVFLPFSSIFSALSWNWSAKLFVLELRQIWSSGHFVKEQDRTKA